MPTGEKEDHKDQYDLFISYYRRDTRIEIGRRKVDLVALFKTELERHLRPKSLAGPKWFRVCTDLDDFELGDTFNAVMSARISRSRKFLLVSSPRCAESPFVKQEVNLFLTLKPGERPLLAVFRQSAGAAFPDLVSDTVVAADLDQSDATTLAEWRKGLRRESHKVVAWVWGMQPSAVFDRFQAQQRAVRNRLLGAAAAITAVFVALVIYLGGDLGLHPSSELAPPHKLVAPAGTGYANDGETAIVFRDRTAYLWRTNHPNNTPAEVTLPLDALYAVQQKPGRELLADVGAVSVFDLKNRREFAHHDVGDEVAGVAAFEEAAAISLKDGSLFFLLANGRRLEAPRPISETGRRLSAFRETAPFVYGELLAMNDKYLATATLTGHLGLLDRTLLTVRDP